MAPAVLLRGGGTFRLVVADRAARTLELTVSDALAEWLAADPSAAPPGPLLRWLSSPPVVEPILVEDERSLHAARQAGRAARLGSWAELRAAREGLPLDPTGPLRRVQLAVAAAALETALADPEQTLISLAREEERLERALGRESAAVEQLLVPSGPGHGTAYREEARRYRALLTAHHAALRDRLESMAREVAPNLTALVGSPLAARLIATAGGTRPLARMSGARIQLLGARRRPSPVRGPRYGHMYRAPRMDAVPAGRTAAYARSLSALAAIAIRADVHTRRDLSLTLVARRDRRVRQLQQGR